MAPSPSKVRAVARQSWKSAYETPAFNVRTLPARIPIATIRSGWSNELGVERLAAGLSLGFGVIALLTSIGLYGSLAYTVARRTSEIGIRMALGAQRSAILGMVASDGLALVLIGLVAGVGASYALASLTASLLYGVPPRDPTTFSLASGTLILVALIASYWPARRATNVDPTMALRSE